MEEEGHEHLGGAIVRIKRLFPGQPAEENGEIEVGDIILAVNGKSLQGLLYQVQSTTVTGPHGGSHANKDNGMKLLLNFTVTTGGRICMY